MKLVAAQVKTSFKPIQALLRENDDVSPVMAQQRRLGRLQKIFGDTLPPGWETLCRVAALEGSTLVIAAANGAIATNLKAYSPRLLENFQNQLEKTSGKKNKQEQEVTSIRVLVQPAISTWRPPTPTSVRLAVQKTPISDAQLADLAGKLGETPLKTTVQRILTKRGAKSKRALTNGD